MTDRAPIDYDRELNGEQKAAVLAPDGPVLVIAAAGTGKTRTLVYRVAHLVERGVDPTRILLLTFTNKAAREMLERAQALVGPAVGGMWGGTFHHLGNRLLRKHAEWIGYRNDYTILDEDDSRSLMRACLQELSLTDKQFPKPDVLLGVNSYAVNSGKGLEATLDERFGRSPVNLDDVRRAITLFETRKRERQSMGFDDLLVNALRLLDEHPPLREAYQERFLHILVDEYQDTNPLQARLVDILADRHRNLLVVGDDFQSIYGWRGANFRHILRFPDHHPGASVFKLETNYRSRPGILAVANRCISGNPEQFQKELRPTRDAGALRPVVAHLRTGDDQSAYIVSRIEALRREGVPLREIAVLYRSHFHSMELQLELTRRRISHQITSGVRFFEQSHVKDVCCLPRLLVNPEDQLAFNRLLGLLPKVGERTALKIWNALGGRFTGPTLECRKALLAALPAGARAAWMPLDEVLGLVDTENLRQNPAQLVGLIADKFYDRYALETFDNHPRRMEDLQALALHAAKFPSLEAFLNELALMSNLEAEDDLATGAESDAVRLSTIHQAKGLEWHTVFVLWLAEGLFPSGRAVENPDEGDTEERRLFYVAVTRARDDLHLCCPQIRHTRDGGVQYLPPSRFLNELRTDLVQTVKPRPVW
jgi:DNA helicase-2/ATP-dependent DNA helicase PcrA